MWLAEEAGVPRTTLVSQVRRGRFSLEVLVRVADALDAGVSDFIPSEHPDSAIDATKALSVLKRYIADRSA
jgi:phosphohistidine phosphatase SixA